MKTLLLYLTLAFTSLGQVFHNGETQQALTVISNFTVIGQVTNNGTVYVIGALTTASDVTVLGTFRGNAAYLSNTIIALNGISGTGQFLFGSTTEFGIGNAQFTADGGERVAIEGAGNVGTTDYMINGGTRASPAVGGTNTYGGERFRVYEGSSFHTSGLAAWIPYTTISSSDYSGYVGWFLTPTNSITLPQVPVMRLGTTEGLTVNGPASFTGATTIGGAGTITGAATLSSTLAVTGAATVGSALKINAPIPSNRSSIAPLEILSGSGTGGTVNSYVYGGSGGYYSLAAGGTSGSPTATVSTDVTRFAGLGIESAGSTNWFLQANVEITPTGTWSVSDHGMTISLWSTPSGSLTRSAVLTIDGSQNTTIINTTKGSFQAGGTATTCTGATIGSGSKANAGFVTATTTGVSTVVITFPFTSTTGWAIAPQNNTTANLIRQTASSTTTATFVGTTVSGDVISYVATAY